MTETPSLRARSRSIVSWTLVQIVVSNGLRLTSNLLLTRLLAPEAFGLISLAMLAITAMAMLSDLGIGRSITREPDGDTTAFLRAAWRAKALRGMFISAGVLLAAFLLWLLGPSLAPPDSTYADPLLPGLIAATALIALMTGFESTCVELSARRMQVARAVIVQLSCQALTVLTMLAAASLAPSPWAIMAGMLLGGLVGCILTHIVYPGPRMGWNSDPTLAARLWNFGRWIILSSSLTFLQSNADRMVLGALLGPTAFGHYVIALIWVEAARQLYAILVRRIVYPAFSEYQNARRADLPRLYRRFQRLGDAFLLTAFVALFFGAETLVGFFYTDAYADSAHFIGLVAFSLLSSRFDPSSELLLSLGDSRATAVTSFIRTIAIAVALPLGWFLDGIDGLILASALHPLAAVPFILWKLKRHLPGLSLAEDWAALTIVIAVGYMFAASS
jgi:O-antigen/teichoic acid export membrane protein